MTNYDLSLQVFSMLSQAGTEAVVVCAGARNAPMVLALQSQNFKVYNFFEERSAAFFALGLIKSSGRPVAVLTTSGTAAAELLPAAVEATYQGLPLILITADRPKSYRGSGAPQVIEQVGIFSHYAEKVYDLDVAIPGLEAEWTMQKPLHLNVCYDEPLIDKAGPGPHHSGFKKISVALPSENPDELKNPLIVLGQLGRAEAALAKDFILKIKAPVYAEAISHLQNSPEIEKYALTSSDALVKQLFRLGLCDSVIRLGGVPTLRFWRDLEAEFKNVPVLNITSLPYSGLARPSRSVSWDRLSGLQVSLAGSHLTQSKELDAQLQKAKEACLEKYSFSEQAVSFHLSRIIGHDGLYLGNSLAIRNWDGFAKSKSLNIYANRGANGIDGQVSTYLGWSQSEQNSYCVIGDLTALYDLASLGLTPQLNANTRNVVVINNYGGQIFNRVFNNTDFINSHATQFGSWAAMWGWDYILVTELAQLKTLKPGIKNRIIEIVPDAEQTSSFWKEWDELCRFH